MRNRGSHGTPGEPSPETTVKAVIAEQSFAPAPALSSNYKENGREKSAARIQKCGRKRAGREKSNPY
jgi:hypothetical protein